MKIHELTSYLESLAPRSYQESYDNSGLLIGSPDKEITGILVTLDCTEEVVEEAVKKGCNMIVAHHPIIFSGLKQLTGRNYVERTVIKAIQQDVAIYAIHTNLDNIEQGVNRSIAERLELTDCRILEPKAGLLRKLVTFVPHEHLIQVRQALFHAGAGSIGNYDSCSFGTEGLGTFKAGDGASPFVGELNQIHAEPETRLEVVFPKHIQSRLIKALREHHPYEEVAFDVYAMENELEQVGSGMIGLLPEPMKQYDFLEYLKTRMELRMIRFTEFSDKMIQQVAICGGAGSFLLRKAMEAGAQAFVTGDFKYHEFFDAEGRIMIADIGHYESEKFTKSLLSDVILKKFPTFAVLLSDINTNPVKYY